VVERTGDARGVSLPTFVTDEPFSAPSTVTLGEDAAHHMRVRRLEPGTPIRLLDGVGGRGTGVLTQLAKRHALVAVDELEMVEPQAAIHLLLPVADKDRMLWLAEKVVELGVTSWRPVVYRRSRDVSPRGEGTTFHQKVRARMSSALAQSGSAWLPTMYPEATVERAVAARPEGLALLLDAGGAPLWDVLAAAPATHGELTVPPPVTIAIGPEGGFEELELSALTAGGFHRCALGAGILRFETAGIAAVAVARAALGSTGGRPEL
jgi:16S rRNA (uracil1498-N3)-methyltransferase